MNGCMWLINNKNCRGCPQGGDEGGCDLAGQDYSEDDENNHENFSFYDDDDETTGWGGGSLYENQISCKYCGAKNLQWKQDINGWKLFTKEGKRHICNDEDIYEKQRKIRLQDEIKRIEDEKNEELKILKDELKINDLIAYLENLEKRKKINKFKVALVNSETNFIVDLSDLKEIAKIIKKSLIK